MEILNLIDKIRRRPGMYIGYHSPTHLDSFLSGFYFAADFNLVEIEKSSFDEFHDWVAQKFNYNESTSGWAHMIEDQREDKEESLWLFFELLDEFRNITHQTIMSAKYLSHYKLDTSLGHYSRKKKIRGTFEFVEKPRPDKLIIRKINLHEVWYSLLALNKDDLVLDVRNSDSLENILMWGNQIYGINEFEWDK